MIFFYKFKDIENEQEIKDYQPTFPSQLSGFDFHNNPYNTITNEKRKSMSPLAESSIFLC